MTDQLDDGAGETANLIALEHPPIRLKQPDRKAAAQTLESGAISCRPDGSVRSESALARPLPGASAPSLSVQGNGAATQPRPAEKPYVAFDRHELSEILKVYGRMVAAGEWRDYAIDHLADRAVFSIFRRASEMPLYRVEKNPKLARKQGAYAVIAQTGMILKRGGELDRVLRVIDKPRIHLAE